MEQNKLNQNITYAIFAVLVIVPLVIGLSVYSRPEPPPQKPPQQPAYPPARPVIRRNYVSGYAYSASSVPISNVYLTYGDGQTYIGQDGYFTVYVAPSTTQLTLSVKGYKPKVADLGQDTGTAYTQNLGIVMFEPELATVPEQWSKYANIRFEYTVSYPSNWKYTEGDYNPGANNQFITFSPKANISVTVTLYNDPNIYSHNTLDDYSQNYNASDQTEQSRSKITINGKPAIQIISKSGLITTLIMRDSDHQVFSWVLWDPSLESKQIYNTMLEKFEY